MRFTIATALRLYRARFPEFLLIALKSVFWAFIPFVVLAAGIIIIALMANAASINANPGSAVFSILGWAVLLIVIYLVLLIFCTAKSQAYEGLIARLSVLDLAERPETAAAGWQQIRRRMWHIWLARFMAAFVVAVGGYGAIFISALIVTPLTVIFGQTAITQILAIIFQFAGYILQLWLFARFLLPDLPVVMERVGGDVGVMRSWTLTKGQDGRIVLLLLVTFLMTILAYIICYLPIIIFIFANSSLIASLNTNNTSRAAALWQQAIATGLPWLIVSIGLLLCLSVLYVPFWQALRGTIYYYVTGFREASEL